ncbi:MAG TPA: hypothetical protein VK603_03775 [Candidatus Saccharimonadales bacterium]|nr:hypothetical protein [Candidatus Saccharimonadales bacterium]
MQHYWLKRFIGSFVRFGVNRAGLTARRSPPVFPYEQTSAAAVGMSQGAKAEKTHAASVFSFSSGSLRLLLGGGLLLRTLQEFLGRRWTYRTMSLPALVDIPPMFSGDP